MDETDIETFLKDAIGCIDSAQINEYVKTFKEATILTKNKGIVIGFEDGSEFQLTIVKSK